MIIEISWNMKNWQNLWNVVISHGILPMLSLEFTKFACFLADSKKFTIPLESLHFLTISVNVGNAKFVPVMENQGNVLQILLEPCR